MHGVVLPRIVGVLTSWSKAQWSRFRYVARDNWFTHHERHGQVLLTTSHIDSGLDLESKLFKKADCFGVVDLDVDGMMGSVGAIGDVFDQGAAESFALFVGEDANVADRDIMGIVGHDTTTDLIAGRLKLHEGTNRGGPSDVAGEFGRVEHVRPRASLGLVGPYQDTFAAFDLHRKVAALE